MKQDRSRKPWRAFYGLLSAVVITGLSAGFSPEAANAAPGLEMAPHRALYTIRLKSAESGSDVTAATGMMDYRVSDQCGGWTTENHTVLTLHYGDRGALNIRWTFVSWESEDGSRYRFRIRNERNDAVAEVFQGEASRTNGDAEAVFVKPEERTDPLPEGTLFPNQHLADLLAAAKSGDLTFVRPMFEGSSDDNPFLVSVAVSPMKDVEDIALIEKAGLSKDVSHFRTRWAFFGYGSRDPIPKYEIDAVYRDDGVARHIIQDFGDFSLDMTLKELERVPVECR